MVESKIHVFKPLEPIEDEETRKWVREQFLKALEVLESKNPMSGCYSMYVTPAIFLIERQR